MGRLKVFIERTACGGEHLSLPLSSSFAFSNFVLSVFARSRHRSLSASTFGRVLVDRVGRD
ncbi:hypothetical protein [Baaleninema simplex]|uniref:hypothetical protein n=1 Tax=Baaleninema simplex TaxID=2862350 RepID=UPI0011819883|nr:hypothetical protein [Baaleninema simplex]